MFRPHRFRRAMPVLFAGIFAPLSSQAATFTVGPIIRGCSHSTLAAAVAAAEQLSGTDTIRVTRTAQYTAQELIISTQQSLNLVGGFANCISTTSDGVQTVLDGAGGNAAPVLRIGTSAAASVITLQGLRITGGDSTGDGGGIRFTGPGTLQLIESTVDLNNADRGGGIHVSGSGGEALLLIGNDNLIAANRARIGGGIYLEGAELMMEAPGSSIVANTATETGGGLQVYDTGALTSIATIGSTGFPPFAAIEGNTAAFGGGVAIFGNSPSRGSLGLFGAGATAPVVMHNNVASQRGGAIDITPTGSFLGLGAAKVDLNHAVLDGNAAPTGAALYAGGATSLRRSTISVVNSRIGSNVGRTAANVPTNDPIIVIGEDSRLAAKRTVFRGNNGGAVIRTEAASEIEIADSLIHGNTSRGVLLSLDCASSEDCLISGSTFAGNTIQGSPAILATDHIVLRNSIIWQPGTTTLLASVRVVADVLASEIASLGSSPSIISAEPRFIDPAAGDYRLQAASPAIDISGAALGDGFDLDGTPRGFDLDRVADFNGAIDLGAYERGALGNLALNPDFRSDRRLWDAGIPGSTATWAAAGAANGGSVTLSMVAAPGGSFTGLRQCIRIPGPGRYRLTGLAYGSGADALTRDDVSLRWNLRHNTGGETCTGPIDAQGSVEFNNTASWSAPPAPGLIDVPPAMFSRFTNVEVLLQVREGSLNINATTAGFFDEIALVADDSAPGDAVFANGFEP